MPKQQRIRDPLHDLVEFNVETSQLEGVLWRIIQTRSFQRLRRIKQLGFSDFVYPGATHSRLLHSVGVFHTARRLMKVIDKYLPAKDARVDQALAAALVHDPGARAIQPRIREDRRALRPQNGEPRSGQRLPDPRQRSVRGTA